MPEEECRDFRVKGLCVLRIWLFRSPRQPSRSGIVRLCSRSAGCRTNRNRSPSQRLLFPLKQRSHYPPSRLFPLQLSIAGHYILTSRSDVIMFSRAVRPAVRAGSAVVTRTAPPNAANFATLREIEGRLKSIKNIEKITNTMKVIASTRLTRAQKAMDESRTYGETSNTVFEKAETKPLEDKKTLLVVASSDKGLCGGIHSGLSKATRRILQGHTDADIVVLGEKAKAQLSRTNPNALVLSFANVCKDIPTFADAQAVADQIALLPADYASVKIIYNKWINAQSYEPATVEAYSEEAITKSANISSFEIDDQALANLREYALANSLFWAMAEGHACEISARRNAMENASKNAGEMINKFQILYNRQRQAAITGELVEIITGATASADM